MLTTLSLEKMSITEKISAMELLWDDICHNAKDFQSPQWHGELLAKREEMMKNGEAKSENWDDVKQELWNELT